MGRPYNELPLLQLQRQHERQEDKARLRLQPRLLSGSDSQRQRGFPQAEQTQFRSQAGNVSRELPGAARSGGFGAAILASLLQCHHSSVSTTVLSDYLFRFFASATLPLAAERTRSDSYRIYSCDLIDAIFWELGDPNEKMRVSSHGEQVKGRFCMRYPRHYFGSLVVDIATPARSSRRCHDDRNFIESSRARLLFFAVANRSSTHPITYDGERALRQ